MRTYNIYRMPIDIKLNFPSEVKFLHHTITKRIDKILEDTKITPQQGMIVSFIYKSNGKIKQNQIQEKFGISKSTVSGLVKRCIENGFIERKGGYLILTPKSIEVKEKIREVEITINEIMLKDFSEEEKENLAKYIEKIKKNMEGDNK